MSYVEIQRLCSRNVPLHGLIVELESLGNGLMANLTSGHVEAIGEIGIFAHGLFCAERSNLESEGKRRIIQGERARSGYCSRHIGDAVMNDSVHFINRIS